MASPWGKPRDWDLNAHNLIHRGTGISTFVGKTSTGSTSSSNRPLERRQSYGASDWRNASTSIPSSYDIFIYVLLSNYLFVRVNMLTTRLMISLFIFQSLWYITSKGQNQQRVSNPCLRITRNPISI